MNDAVARGPVRVHTVLCGEGAAEEDETMAWVTLSNGVSVKPEGDGALDDHACVRALVSQGGGLKDDEVADMLSVFSGARWARSGEWSAASGEGDVTAIWEVE